MTFRFVGIHSCSASDFTEMADEKEYSLVTEASSLQLPPGNFPRALDIDGEKYYVSSWDKDAVRYLHDNGSSATILND